MASNEEILAGLAEIVNEETGLATEAVEMDKSFTEDLDIDSISMMTIVVNAEEKFGVRIPDEEVKNLKTVGDAVSFIAERTGLIRPRPVRPNWTAGPRHLQHHPGHHPRVFQQRRPRATSPRFRIRQAHRQRVIPWHAK